MGPPVVLILGAVLLLSAFPAGAEVLFGPKAGTNISKFSGADGDLFDSRKGYSIGVALAFTLGRSIAVQSEFFYTEKGAEGDTLGFNEAKLTYIEIPVLLKINLPSFNLFTPCVFAGPAFAANVAARAKNETTGVEEKIDSMVKGTDLGFVFGVGIDTSVGPGLFGLDARYTLGSSQVDDLGAGLDPDLKNSTFSVMISYLWPQ
jgi:hypothetical protein